MSFSLGEVTIEDCSQHEVSLFFLELCYFIDINDKFSVELWRMKYDMR